MLSENSNYFLHVDDIIGKLINLKYGERANLAYKDMLAIAYVSRNLFQKEHMCLELEAPINVCGDIHGQFIDLLRIFNLCGYPPDKKYLFLGDYVDRGTYGVECVCLLFALKIKYPKNIFLLRGNHECEALNCNYGFRDEIRSREGSSKVWKAFLKSFNVMPSAALIEKTIFCCHGGISPLLLEDSVTNLKDTIDEIERPTDIVLEGLLCDLVWSDPMEQDEKEDDPAGWKINDRGCSWTFGYDVLEKFLQKFDLDLVVRGHQVVDDGYEFYCDRKLLTVFSAPHYCGKFDNAGGIFCLKKERIDENSQQPIVEGSFIILKPDYNLPSQWAKPQKKR